MQTMISVIVPVYNAEKYVSDCINSVLGQTYTNFELILVDDGSKDCSQNICRKMRERDQRIQLLVQKHKGVSTARNRGIRNARGKYLFFLDSDDTIHPYLFGTLLDLMEKYDSSVGTEIFSKVNETDFLQEQVTKIQENEKGRHNYISGEELWENFNFGKEAAQLHSIGGKMIRRDVIKGGKFKKNLVSGEDTLFIYCLLLNNPDAVVLQEKWYYYRQIENNASKKYSLKACQSNYKVCKYISRKEQKNGRQRFAEQWECFIIVSLINWYVEGKQCHDKKLISWVQKHAELEKRTKLFSEMNQYTKNRFFESFN